MLHNSLYLMYLYETPTTFRETNVQRYVELVLVEHIVTFQTPLNLYSPDGKLSTVAPVVCKRKPAEYTLSVESALAMTVQRYRSRALSAAVT